MFAVVNHLQFNKPVDEFRDIVQADGIPMLSKHPGFIDFHLVKVDEYNAIVLILWQDAESARSGAKAFGPTWFATHIKPHLAGGENRSVGEIIASSKLDK
jgi:heme-degrading monooxygenase HmoA